MEITEINMDNLELKLNDNGEVVQVVTITQVDEVPLSSAELQRQIDEHQAVVDTLTAQYATVKAFEDSHNL